nr:hypothetical protein [Allosalinactinospora lopnorensis]
MHEQQSPAGLRCRAAVAATGQLAAGVADFADYCAPTAQALPQAHEVPTVFDGVGDQLVHHEKDADP